jgi:hypothetical protein
MLMAGFAWADIAGAMADEEEGPVVHAAVAPRPLPHAKGFAAGVRQVLTFYMNDRCQPEMAKDDQAYALGDSEMIVLLGCNPGDDQNSYFVFRAPFGRPDLAKQVALPLPPTLSAKDFPPDRQYFGELSWDAKTATLIQFDRGGAKGDCGTRTRWTFDGVDFPVTEFRRQSICGPGGDFPIVYRARVETR